MPPSASNSRRSIISSSSTWILDVTRPRGACPTPLRPEPTQLGPMPTELQLVSGELQPVPAELRLVPVQLQPLPVQPQRVPAQLQTLASPSVARADTFATRDDSCRPVTTRADSCRLRLVPSLVRYRG